MPDLRTFLTPRLELRAAAADDVDGLFAITSDPDQWWHAPQGRHADRETTADWIERAAARWESDGLSYWMARAVESGAIIGVGGAQRHATGTWNLYWRIATVHQGHGYATELGRAALAAAAQFDDSVPAIAWILSHNTPSIAVARRLELIDHGLLADPSDRVERLAFADRPLAAHLLLPNWQ